MYNNKVILYNNFKIKYSINNSRFDICILISIIRNQHVMSFLHMVSYNLLDIVKKSINIHKRQKELLSETFYSNENCHFFVRIFYPYQYSTEHELHKRRSLRKESIDMLEPFIIIYNILSIMIFFLIQQMTFTVCMKPFHVLLSMFSSYSFILFGFPKNTKFISYIQRYWKYY